MKRFLQWSGRLSGVPLGALSGAGGCGIIVNPEAAASIHDDGVVILDNRSGRLFTSNQTGARIWRCIERRSPQIVYASGNVCRRLISRERSRRLVQWNGPT